MPNKYHCLQTSGQSETNFANLKQVMLEFGHFFTIIGEEVFIIWNIV